MVCIWCTHKCDNCQNPLTWDVNGGIPFDEKAKDELFNILSKDYISGITFSGGDPLHPKNKETVLKLIKEIKILYPQKTIWLYTGFKWENVYNLWINAIYWCFNWWRVYKCKKKCTTTLVWKFKSENYR